MNFAFRTGFFFIAIALVALIIGGLFQFADLLGRIFSLSPEATGLLGCFFYALFGACFLALLTRK